MFCWVLFYSNINAALLLLASPAGTFLFARACLQAMKKQIAADGAAAALSTSNGKLIFMGSIHSKEASVLKSAYVAAKHALLGFTRAVSKEAGPSAISCNLICPGFVLTPLVQKQIPEQAKTLGISEKEVREELAASFVFDNMFFCLQLLRLVSANVSFSALHVLASCFVCVCIIACARAGHQERDAEGDRRRRVFDD